MIAEPIRIVRDYLRNDTSGYVAQLAALPVDAADTGFTKPMVDDKDILSMVDDKGAADREVQNSPALIVTQDTPVTFEGKRLTGAFKEAEDFFVTVRFLGRKASLADNMRDTAYAMRAVRLSMQSLALAANQASRTRNHVCLRLSSMTLVPTREKVGNLLVTAGLVTAWHYKDLVNEE